MRRLDFPASRIVHILRTVAVEAWWWMSGAARLWWQYTVRASAHLLAMVGLWAYGQELLAAALLAPVVGIGLWARLRPSAYYRWLADPLLRHRVKRNLRRSWSVIMESVGLARRTLTVTRPPRKAGDPAAAPAELLEIPALAKARWVDPGHLVAWPRLLIGQTVEDMEAVTDRLRVAMDANRCQVRPNEVSTACTIVWSFGDPLRVPFFATVPEVDAPVGDLRSVPVGLTEDGTVWRLPLVLSTLVAGVSGSGKMSIIWGLVFGLGPANKAGLVQLLGIDLKGGMELAMGRALFTRYAQTAEAAVVMLEDAVADLQARAERLAGVTRQHTPCTADPLVVIVIDELAALIAYSPNRDLIRRAEAALSIILTQGRAVGFLVFAFLQDPRKETVRMRHLFPQSMGLRLREREEVAMVLSDGAVAAGALCHKIPKHLPGVGYVLGEDDNRPVRVRAGNVSDTMIKLAEARFAAPAQVPIVVPEPAEPTRPRSSRSPRANRSPVGSEDAA